eukprot:m.337508 g.337508  ORF g.337508 m.337508 type:complete len:372 (-) comp18152_c0_seq1:1049-2164(-)
MLSSYFPAVDRSVIGFTLILLILFGSRGQVGAISARNLVIPHENIIMALHGLMDHVIPEEFLENQKQMEVRYARYIKEGAPGWNDIYGQLNATDKARHGATQLYKWMDMDENGRLYMDELALWLVVTVSYHHGVSQNQSHQTFKLALSPHETGSVTGQSQGVNFPIVQQLISRDPNKKMDAVKSEAAFKDADENKDGLLNITEFFSFEYPEFSLSVQRRYAESFLKDHDRNGDGYVNSSEFLQTALQVKEPGQDKYSVQAFEHRAEEKEWLREFDKEFDSNHDGKLDRDELAVLFSPLHASHAISEAYILGMALDTNGDHEISKQEAAEGVQHLQQSHLMNFAVEVRKDLDKMYAELTKGLKQRARRRDEL